jgi:hypothetical protein
MANGGRPLIFFASSSEEKSVLEQLARIVIDDRDQWARPLLWAQAFAPGQSYLESLVKDKSETDFAVILYTPNDETRSRGVLHSSPRDNILFELGFFIAALGPARTLIVCPQDHKLKFPSDYAGYALLSYDASDGEPSQYLWSAGVQIRDTFKKLHNARTVQPAAPADSTTIRMERRRAQGEFVTIYRDAAANLNWFADFKTSMEQAVPSFKSRMLYFGPGLATHWNRISREYDAYPENLEVFKGTLRGMLAGPRSDGINLIDLGIGNFDKGEAILSHCLNQPEIKAINYFPYDVSYEMLALALQIGEDSERDQIRRRVQTQGSIVAINALFADLDRYNHLFSPPSRNVFLLLGNTLGNEPDEIETLRDIRKGMNAGDVLITELQLVEEDPLPDTTLTENIQSSAYFYVGPFTAIGGGSVADFKISVRRDLDEERDRGSMAGLSYKIICRPRSVREVRHPAYRAGEVVRIPGRDIVVYIVRKYRAETVAELFRQAGFDEISVASSPGEGPRSRRFCYITARKAEDPK